MKYGNGLHKFSTFGRNDRVNRDNTFGPAHETGRELIEHATELKDEGDYYGAMDVLKLIADDGRDDSAVLAAYELALLQSQLGMHTKADRHLKRLGFSLKLTNAILSPARYREVRLRTSVPYPHPFVPEVKRGCDPVVSFNQVLPMSLLQSLQTAFSPSSVFWTEHKYPTDSFFSYNISKTDRQASVMTQLIDHLIPLVTSHFPNFKQPSVGSSVEWWCHMRDETSGCAHQLHFDLDESALRDYSSADQSGEKCSISQQKKNESEMRSKLHPTVSAVLFLSDNYGGAPTLVTDQTLDNGSVATQAWLCHPAVNRLLLFDGNLLHGVVPHLEDRTEEAKKLPGPRITLMMGFWDKEFQSTSTTGLNINADSRTSLSITPLGPNMPMPSASTTSSAVPNPKVVDRPISNHKGFSTTKKCKPSMAVTWPSLFAPVSDLEKDESGRRILPNTSTNPAGLVHIPGPIWIPVGVKKTKVVSTCKGIRNHSADDDDDDDDDDSEDDDSENDDDSEDDDDDRVNEEDTVERNEDCDDSKNNPPKIDYGGAVEFIPVAELNRLRDPMSCKSEISNCSTMASKVSDTKKDGKKSTKRKRKSSDEDNIVFTGKWFLRDINEIRNDVFFGARK